MQVWEPIQSLINTVISSVIVPVVSFVIFRSKLTEKIDFIVEHQNGIKILIYLTLFTSLLFAFLTLLDPWFLVGFIMSLLLFSIAYLSINFIPHEYIRTKVKEYSECTPKEMKKERTDIQWKFDELLGGGMPSGHICLITGPPGVGITILSFEILYNGLKMRDQRGLFISMNETITQLRGRLSTVWSETDKIQAIRFEEVMGDTPPYPYINWKRIFGLKIRTFSWEYPIYIILREHDNHPELKRIVIDLPPFFEEISREQIINFFDTLSKIAYGLDLLVVVTCRTCESSLEQLAPIVINLNRKFFNDGRAVSTLSILKNVGFPSSPSEYEFEIRGHELGKNLGYKLEGLRFEEKENRYKPYNKPIPGIWIFETSFKVGEK